MEVVGHERPCEDAEAVGAAGVGDPVEEVDPVGIGTEDVAALDAASDDMVQNAGCVEPGLACNGSSVAVCIAL